MGNFRVYALLGASVFLLGGCGPSEPRQVTGNFDPSPVKQVTAEANKDNCGGQPKEVVFEVKIKLNIIPADARVNMAGHLSITGEHAADFRFEGSMNRFLTNNNEATIRLVFKPTEVGPRFATIVLDLPANTHATGKIVVHLVGLATCQNDDGAIGDKDGDGLTDNHDPKPAIADADLDGIPDGREDKDFNGEAGPRETDPSKKDTDGDGKNDGDEDINKNGRVDDGETDPTNPNSR